MSRAAEAPSRPRRRRTQEERSAATRAKVVEAATACVAEQGFRGATMGAMAQRAGLSWGALQHQFGEKEAIFDAVLEQAIARLRDQLGGLREAHPEPADRVRALMRCFRQLARGPSYRAFVEIQLNRARASEPSEAWTRYVAQSLSEAWRELFGDLGLPKRRLDDAQRFAFAVLSGIASESTLFPGADFSRRSLDILEATLLRLLEVDE